MLSIVSLAATCRPVGGIAMDFSCGGLWLSGSDAARALGQASLSPMLEGGGSIPIQDVGFSPLICDTD